MADNMVDNMVDNVVDNVVDNMVNNMPSPAAYLGSDKEESGGHRDPAELVSSFYSLSLSLTLLVCKLHW